jgi:hypothetical protein
VKGAVGKRVAIVQSSYIPWKGYFDLIHSVDEFVLFDDVQYTRRDWRNRNRIKTPQGTLWLTIPVESKGRYHELIKDMTLSDPEWNRKHWRCLAAHYSRARFFRQLAPALEDLYLGAVDTSLSQVNRRFLEAVCRMLGIETRITWSMDYSDAASRELRKTERLVDVCKRAGASFYLSGPSARAYIEPALFEREGIELGFMDYSGYPEYEQLHPPFVHEVSILDLLLNQGPEARHYMLSFGVREGR